MCNLFAFIFSSFWVWLGTLIMIILTGSLVSDCLVTVCKYLKGDR